MRLFLFLDGTAGIVHGIHDFSGKALSHRLFAAGSGIRCNPAQTERHTSFRLHVHRNLIGRTADTSCLDLSHRHDVVHGCSEALKRILAQLFFHDLKCVIHDFLRHALLAVIHDVVHQPGNKLGIVHRIRQNVSLGYLASSRHCTSLLHDKYDLTGTRNNFVNAKSEAGCNDIFKYKHYFLVRLLQKRV